MRKDVIAGVIVLIAIVGILIYSFWPVQNIQKETQNVTYIDISSVEAKALIDNNPSIIILDVSPNYENGHIEGAINYYVGDGSLDNAIEAGELDKDATYLVYCHVASASMLGAQKLIDAGFKNVYRLEDNYAGWAAAGFPLSNN